MILSIANTRLSPYFQEYRTYATFRCQHSSWYDARMTAKELWHPCPDCATCITPGRLYEPSSCQPCQTFLTDMRQDPAPSSLARKTWVKWNRTLVNRWKKNNVALYSPSNVRMLLWADAALFSSYEAVLPPAPPSRSTSRESLLSAGKPATSSAIPGEDGDEQDRGSPWSGFEEVIPPNQEARPVNPPVQTTQPPPEAVPGPSLLPTPTQPSSEPTLSMLMQMLSGIQSEIKNLRNELAGSVSSLIAEAVANQLPQVIFLILLTLNNLNNTIIFVPWVVLPYELVLIARLVVKSSPYRNLFLPSDLTTD